jgi:hypothetical protein
MRRRLVVICLGLCLTAGLCYWLVLRSYAVSWALSEQMGAAKRMEGYLP